MNTATLTRRLTLQRLRVWLALLFVLLTAPITALVWHAYGQLKWEAFHQYRGMSEELSDRINNNLAGRVKQAESRRFADYSFLIVAGDTTAPFLQRSPLSELPVVEDLPGTIGYFQIDTNGQFSTPALPNKSTPPKSVGIGSADLQARQTVAKQLLDILSENRLVDGLSDSRDELADAVELEELELRAGSEREEGANKESTTEQMVSEAAASEYDYRTNDNPTVKVNSQLAFDKLKSLGSSVNAGHAETEPGTVDNSATVESAIAISASAPDIDLDLRKETGSLAKPDAKVTAEQTVELQITAGSLASDQLVRRNDIEQATENARAARKERSYISEIDEEKQAMIVAEVPYQLADRDAMEEKTVDVDAMSDQALTAETLTESLGSRRITTFESDVDPIEISLLDSGHFVAFRKVWREGQRLIQGVLIDRQVFVDQLIREPFQQAQVSSMSSLSLLYQNKVLDTFGRNERNRYYNEDSGLRDTQLYRIRLADPLNALELVFSIKQLPPGPGARVLALVTAALAVVFLSGFYLLYRVGREQIALATQQQDFVSAVSHELKTPLTSIRLYGEMLKEGWASEDKKQQYYVFIHDESERLSRLIENVLKLARINRNELVLDLQPITVLEMMESIRQTLKQQAEHSSFDVRFELEESIESTVVVVDQDSVMQIMINLLDNAIKFSKQAERKVIEISAFGDGVGKILLSVRDYGPGIPRDQLTTIFRMFYRSESELTRATVGTGIGLAIVHQLCIAMQADVAVLNRHPGAEFLVTLPVALNTKNANFRPTQ